MAAQLIDISFAAGARPAVDTSKVKILAQSGDRDGSPAVRLASHHPKDICADGTASSNSCYIEKRKAPRQNAGWYLTPSPDNPRVLFRAGSLPPLLCSANWGFYALWLTMVTSAPPVPLENTTKKPVLKPHGAAVCGDGLLLDTSITAMTVPVASRPS